MHILMFKVKSVCYDSTFYLADLYGRMLETFGHQVTYFNSDDEPITALDRYIGMHFDAMLDFNSLLPNLDTDEGKLFLDTIDAPFYNYILDHPLYHNKQLKAPLARYHVICLDTEHAEYISRYYPHIRSVHVLPLCGLPFLSGTESYQVSKLFKNFALEQVDDTQNNIDEISKKYDLIFTGTYSDPNMLYQRIKGFDEPMSGQMQHMIEIMLAEPALNQEQALLRMLTEEQIPVSKISVPEHLYAFFMVDMYVKSYYREQVLNQVLSTGRTLCLYGGMWDVWQTGYASQLDIHEMVPFKDSPRVLAGAWISLNVMPWFKAGIHDRVLTAMRSGTVSLTDDSRMLDQYFAKGEDLLVYDLAELDRIPEMVEYYLEHKNALRDMATQGRLKADAQHSEIVRVHALEQIFSADTQED